MGPCVSQSRKVCFEIMRYLVRSGFAYQVPVKEVEKAIIWIRGSDKRTLQNWKRALETLGYLERINVHLYKMNLTRCPELLHEVLHEPRQKKLM